jgi:hypothetical protein
VFFQVFTGQSKESEQIPWLAQMRTIALDPMVQRTMGDEMWEGEVEQSGTITIKGTWR